MFLFIVTTDPDYFRIFFLNQGLHLFNVTTFFNPFQSIIHIETRVNFLQYNTNHVIPELRIQQFPNSYKIKHSKLKSYISYCSTPASPKSYVPGTIPYVL